MQFIGPLAYSVVEFLLQAMEDEFICNVSLAIHMRMSHLYEPFLTPQGAEVISHLRRTELPTVVKDYHMRNSTIGDDILPNEILDLGHGD